MVQVTCDRHSQELVVSETLLDLNSFQEGRGSQLINYLIHNTVSFPKSCLPFLVQATSDLGW